MLGLTKTPVPTTGPEEEHTADCSSGYLQTLSKSMTETHPFVSGSLCQILPI